MDISIETNQNLVTCLNDLEKFVPESLSGKALNYGQGEGQFKIEDTVWGIYVSKENVYTLQHEEGSIDIKKFIEITNLLILQIESEFGKNIRFKVQGKLNHYQPHEKYI